MIEAKINGRIREVIEERLEEELDTALGAGRHEHTEGLQGYRQGSNPARQVPVELTVGVFSTTAGYNPDATVARINSVLRNPECPHCISGRC